MVWSYQLVHHDLWDYDNPAQPSLATITLDGKKRDVVIQGTKQGLVFVLDRETGQPVLPIEERPVPQGGVAGEVLSPTQPFPADLPPLGPDRITPEQAWGLTPWDRGACAQAISSARSEGRFTPPSLQGTLVMPFTGGGVNWGGLAVDGGKGVVYVNSSNMVHRITLFPAADYAQMKQRFPDKEVSPQRGAPYGMKRELLVSPLGLPCNPPPWGVLTALDLGSRKILWQAPLGTTEELNPLGLASRTGTPTFGGPLATASGLVFIGAALDDYLRAFDAKTGAELWTGRLPSAGIATPTSYLWQGRQFVLIAAGGHGEAGAPAGDTLVAFALPGPGESGPSPWLRWLDLPGGRFELHAGMAVIVVLVLAVLWWRRRRRRHRRPDRRDGSEAMAVAYCTPDRSDRRARISEASAEARYAPPWIHLHYGAARADRRRGVSRSATAAILWLEGRQGETLRRNWCVELEIDFAPNSLLRAKSRNQFPALAKKFPARLLRELSLK